MTTDQLDRAAVAARYGIKPATVTREVLRGSLPRPDGYMGRAPWWHAATLDGWKRPGRTGRPKVRRNDPPAPSAGQRPLGSRRSEGLT